MSATENKPVPPSLASRLLLAASVLLVAFLGLTGLALDRAFRASVVELSHERLEARIYLLLGAAQVSPDGDFSMPEPLAEPRLSMTASGAYAAVSDATGAWLWRSASSLTTTVPYPEVRGLGKPSFGEAEIPGAGTVLTVTYPVVWELENGGERYLAFHVAESKAGLDAQGAGFRRTLWLWLGAVAAMLLVAQLAMLFWSLTPLRRVSREVQAVQSGRQADLRGGYPRELLPLTDNLNRLLSSNRLRLKRYREALADLAHSLKTPLAVLRTGLDQPGLPPQPDLMREQVDRMEHTINYQLQRAAASGQDGLSAPVAVLPVAQRVVRALEKLHAERALRVELDILADTHFSGDPGDLQEILGNLADNAFKWAAGRVRIRARNPAAEPRRLALDVEDDGPGIPEGIRADALHRGVRLDTAVPGHGIGLAVVRDIVEQAYGGRLEILPGEAGGTRVRVLV